MTVEVTLKEWLLKTILGRLVKPSEPVSSQCPLHSIEESRLSCRAGEKAEKTAPTETDHRKFAATLSDSTLQLTLMRLSLVRYGLLFKYGSSD